MTKRQQDLHFTRVSGAQGSPEKWCLVLHGILGSGANFRAVARALTEARPEWGTLLVDLRMHGRSQDMEGEHTVTNAARDLFRVVEQAPGPVRGIMGHSFGGKVALAHLGMLEQPLERAWILDSNPGPRPDRAGSDETRAVLDMLDELPARFPDRAAFVAHVVERGFSQMLGQWLAMNLIREEDGGFRFGLQLSAIRSLLDDYFELDLWPVIEQSATPIELVIAGRSQVFGAADRQRATQSAQRRGVRVHDMPDAGHWLHVDDPEGLHTLLVAEM